jgi:prophage tail gpP-like protein
MSQPAYPGYATPTFTVRGIADAEVNWLVTASPWGVPVGITLESGPAGWEAFNNRGRRVGLFPTQQAAGEALVRHAGYEVLG